MVKTTNLFLECLEERIECEINLKMYMNCKLNAWKKQVATLVLRLQVFSHMLGRSKGTRVHNCTILIWMCYANGTNDEARIS